jgi:hypothetical protein
VLTQAKFSDFYGGKSLKMKKIAILGAGFALASTLSFGSVIIDNFSTNQTAITLQSGSNDTAVATGANAIGGERNITLNIVTTNPPNIATVGVAGGTMDYSNDVGIASNIQVLWDGGTDNTVTPNGFSAVDLTELGVNDVVRITTLGDFALNAVLTLYSGAGNSATWNFVLPSSGVNVDVDLLFSAPTSTIGTFLATGVTAATLTVDGVQNADRSIDFIQATSTGAPEPATFAIFGAGLAALGLLRRRAKKA